MVLSTGRHAPVVLTIRSATPSDETALLALWREAGLTIPANDPHDDLHFALRGPCSDVLVGLDETGAIVASVMVGHDGHRGWIYYVAVAADQRNQGLGRQIVSAAETWLRQRGVPKMQLLVRETNAQAAAFYQRLGFEPTPRIVMGKRLHGAP